jgi:hypothetical protein
LISNPRRKDSTTKVGNQLNLEGGFGGDFLKNKTFALGPEATLAIAAGRAVRGFITVRYQWETYARVTTQGSALNVSATFLTKPIKAPGA